MKVVLLSNVPRIGNKYDIKDVNDGFAMNFLIPKKLAKIATTEVAKEIEKMKKNVQIERQIQDDLLIKNLDEIKGKVVIIKERASESGSLFSGVNKKEIISQMQKLHNITISEEALVLNKPIKELGEYEIQIDIKNKKSSFKLIIEREE
ncbi:MAG: 50S ribosomal protein L9 [Candidatus Paceibacterota bacterium]|jgi:large subunit ribosomal protein L9